MIETKNINGFEVFTITAADNITSASFVPKRGGIGSSLIMPYKDTKRELLFLHDHFWNPEVKKLPGGWPFLFPVCARLERMGKQGDYLYDGKVYHLDSHGFAWQMPWQVVNNTDNNHSITLELTSDSNTMKIYPFKFRILLKYTVKPKQLICEQIYTNLDTKPMPYYAGFHPYFLTPEANKGKEKVTLSFNPIRTLEYNERLTDIISEKPPLTTPVFITDPHINETLSEVPAENSCSLTYPDGFKLNLQIQSEPDVRLFPYIQLYTIPEKPFICVEPWMAFPNALNTVAGVKWIQPGKSDKAILTLNGSL